METSINHTKCDCCHNEDIKENKNEETNQFFVYLKEDHHYLIADRRNKFICCGGKGTCKKRIIDYYLKGKCLKCNPIDLTNSVNSMDSGLI